MQTCGAKTRNGTPCKSRPVTGSARCRMHGGTQPKGVENANFKHGRYSQYLPQTIADKAAAFEDDNPLDLLPELAVQRALYADYLDRFKTGYVLTAGDIDMLMGWGAEIGKMTERIVKMRNDTALTAAEVKFLAARIADVVARYIDDPDTRRAFVRELLGATGTTRQLTSRD